MLSASSSAIEVRYVRMPTGGADGERVTIFQRGTLFGPLSVREALCKELTKNRGHITVSRVSGPFASCALPAPCGT